MDPGKFKQVRISRSFADKSVVHPSLVIRGEDMMQHISKSLLVRLKVWQTDDVLTNQSQTDTLKFEQFPAYLGSISTFSLMVDIQSISI